MLSLSYLQTILNGKISGIDDTERQIIESEAGYDGIIALIQTKGISPILILENSDVGNFSARTGGFENTSQSIWVMRMVGRDDSRKDVQAWCKAMMRLIIGVLLKHKPDPQLKQWEEDRIPWGVRNAGANYTGYEFTLHFSEDTDLSYHG